MQAGFICLGIPPRPSLRHSYAIGSQGRSAVAQGEVTNSIGNVCRRSIKLWELEQLENNVSNFLLLLFFAATVSDRE
jgi:hypothetical protein